MKYLISASGLDRVGLVSDLSNIITHNSGNIENSRMVKLDGDFAILMLIEIDLSKEDLLKKLNILDSLNIFIHKSNQSKQSSNKVCEIILEGADNEGIVYNITDYLSKKNINIESIETHVSQAPITGINLFHMKSIIKIPKNFEIDKLKGALSRLGEILGIDLYLNCL